MTIVTQYTVGLCMTVYISSSHDTSDKDDTSTRGESGDIALFAVELFKYC